MSDVAAEEVWKVAVQQARSKFARIGAWGWCGWFSHVASTYAPPWFPIGFDLGDVDTSLVSVPPWSSCIDRPFQRICSSNCASDEGCYRRMVSHSGYISVLTLDQFLYSPHYKFYILLSLALLLWLVYAPQSWNHHCIYHVSLPSPSTSYLTQQSVKHAPLPPTLYQLFLQLRARITAQQEPGSFHRESPLRSDIPSPKTSLKTEMLREWARD